MKKVLLGNSPASLATLIWARNKAKALGRGLDEDSGRSHRLSGPFGEAVKIAAKGCHGQGEARVETPGLGFFYTGQLQVGPVTFSELVFAPLPFMEKGGMIPGAVLKLLYLNDTQDTYLYRWWPVQTGGLLRVAVDTTLSFARFNRFVDWVWDQRKTDGQSLGAQHLLAVLLYPKAYFLIHDREAEWRLYGLDYQDKPLSETPLTLADPLWDEYLRASVFQGNGGYFYVAIERTQPHGLTLIDIERRHVDAPNVALIHYPRFDAPGEPWPPGSPAVAMAWQWVKIAPAVWRAMTDLQTSATVQLEGVDTEIAITITVETVDEHVTRNHGTVSRDGQTLEVVIRLNDGVPDQDVYAASLDGEDIALRLKRMIFASAEARVITGIYEKDDKTTITWMKGIDPATSPLVRPASDFWFTAWTGTSLSGVTQAIDKLDFTLTGGRMLQDERIRFIQEYGPWLLVCRSVKTWSGVQDNARFTYDLRIYDRAAGTLLSRQTETQFSQLRFISPTRAYGLRSPDLSFEYGSAGRIKALLPYGVDEYAVSGEVYPVFEKRRSLTEPDTLTTVNRVGSTGQLQPDISLHWIGFIQVST